MASWIAFDLLLRRQPFIGCPWVRRRPCFKHPRRPLDLRPPLPLEQPSFQIGPRRQGFASPLRALDGEDRSETIYCEGKGDRSGGLVGKLIQISASPVGFLSCVLCLGDVGKWAELKAN